jgi:hypothetical protein
VSAAPLTRADVKLVKVYDGDEGEYDVIVRATGDYVGTVSRRHRNHGYWGMWTTGRHYYDTRAEAVEDLLRRRNGRVL